MGGAGAGGGRQPGRGASLQGLPVDLEPHCDSWAGWLQPVSLLEEARDERVNFFLQAVKPQTKQALSAYPETLPFLLTAPGEVAGV